MAQSPTYLLTDEQWQALAPLLPTNENKRGGQWSAHRRVIDGILWVLSDGGRWRNVPKEFGPWPSAYDRFRRWTRSGLWEWMREEVTQRHGHDTVRDLFDACKRFVDEIDREPLAVVGRLWPRFDLDPEVEKLGFSS